MNPELNNLSEEIVGLQKQLSEKYNCDIKIKYTIHKYSRELIKNCCDTIFKEKYPDRFVTIAKHGRWHIHVLFRYIYFKLCIDVNHTLVDSANYIGFDHATVHTGLRRFNNLLETNDFHSTKYYNLVKNELKK